MFEIEIHVWITLGTTGATSTLEVSGSVWRRKRRRSRHRMRTGQRRDRGRRGWRYRGGGRPVGAISQRKTIGASSSSDEEESRELEEEEAKATIAKREEFLRGSNRGWRGGWWWWGRLDIRQEVATTAQRNQLQVWGIRRVDQRGDRRWRQGCERSR